MLGLIFILELIKLQESSDVSVHENSDTHNNDVLSSYSSLNSKNNCLSTREEVEKTQEDKSLIEIGEQIDMLNDNKLIFKHSRLTNLQFITVSIVIDYFINKISLENLKLFFKKKIPPKCNEKLNMLSEFFKLDQRDVKETLRTNKKLDYFFNLKFRINKNKDDLDEGINKFVELIPSTYAFIPKTYKNSLDMRLYLICVLYKMKKFLNS